MQPPLDHFEPDSTNDHIPELQRVVGLFTWLGLLVLNAALANVVWDNWDRPLLALEIMALYIVLSLQFTYALHLLLDKFFLGLCRWMLRNRPQKGLAWRLLRLLTALFTALKLGVISQLLVLLYFTPFLFWFLYE